MRRREFLGVLGGVWAGWPVAARAQQTMPVIGYVSGRSLEYEERLLLSFRKGLEEEGYAAGRNIAVQYRFSDGDDSRLPAIAADFVRRQVAVIVASGPSAVAAKGATSTIPIVFSSGDDPVGRRSRRQPQPTGRQCDRRRRLQQRARTEAAGSAT